MNIKKGEVRGKVFFLSILLFIFAFATPLASAQIIISTSDVEIWSGESATLDVVVMNPAGVDASFDVVIPQPCPVGQSGIIRKTIAAGSTSTISIRVGAGAASVDESGRCQVKVSATTKPSNYDTAYFNFKMHKARECSPPGKYQGDLQTGCIEICGDDGLWHEVKCCEKDERLSYDSKYAYDGWECVKKNNNIPGFESIFAVIGLIFVFFIFRRRRKRV